MRLSPTPLVSNVQVYLHEKTNINFEYTKCSPFQYLDGCAPRTAISPDENIRTKNMANNRRVNKR
jgi:hypothetical protein